MYLKGWTSLDSPEAVKRAAEVLEDAGWIREVSFEAGPNGGRPSSRYEINPGVAMSAAMLMNWKPKTRIFSKVATRYVLQYLQNPVLMVWGASRLFHKGGKRHRTEAIAGAMGPTPRRGVRIMRFGADLQIGIWQDLDGPERRDAIRAVGMGDQPVVHLEGPNVPTRYKVRNCLDRKTNESFASWIRRARDSST